MKTQRASTGSVLVLLATLTVASCSGNMPRPTSRDTQPRARRTVMTAADIEKYAGAGSIEQLLVQHVPGLQLVTRADGSMTLLIMGLTNSRTISGEPLYVVDGIPMMSSSGRIGVSPYDVAWVEVLKDGGALAQYGLRGAQGVVLIRTKRGGETYEPTRRGGR